MIGLISSDLCWLKDECNRCDCNGFCLRLFKLDYLYEEALIPINLRKKVELITGEGDYEAFTILKELSHNIEDFVGSGKNIFIHSATTGNGKSSWAIRLVQEYFNRIWYKSELKCRALFISVPKLLIELKRNIDNKSEYAQHIIDNVLDADIVIWDDIATKAITTFEAENLFSMIDARICSGKSNIYTSNLSNDEMLVALGDRLASRVCNCDYNLEFVEPDKRGGTK